MFRLTIFALAGALLLPSVQVNAVERFKEGVDYATLDRTQATRNDVIEIHQFFWYGCSHCRAFEPKLEVWRETLSSDALVVPVPAFWKQQMVVHARAHYIAMELGIIKDVAPVMYKVLEGGPYEALSTQSAVRRLFRTVSTVEPDIFDSIWSSASMTRTLRKAHSRAANAGITGTPELVVAGRYRVSAQMAGGQENMLVIAKYLVELERSRRQIIYATIVNAANSDENSDVRLKEYQAY